MRNFVKFSMLALVALATTASAAELEFHGYTRAGFGFSSKGSTQVAFGLSSADTKFRLGNEPDYVIEPGFEYKFSTLEDKSAWGVNVMPAYYRRYGGADNVLQVQFKQIYFFGNNVPQLLNGQIWAGRRYIERLQTGINDQFLENEDGDGAGVQDMDVGFGKLTINLLSDPNGAGLNNTLKFCAHITGIQTFSKDAALQIWLREYDQVKVKDQPKQDARYSVGLYHTWNLGDLGSNLTGFKWNNTKDDNVYRVVFQHGITFAAAKTSVDVLAEYRIHTHKDLDSANWLALGARSDTQISGPFRFLLELGYDMTKQGKKGGDNKTHSLFKGTGALAVSGGNDPWSRPTFRFYVTYAAWNKDANADVRSLWVNGNDDGSNRLAQAYNKDETNGATFGIQAEGWW